MLSYQLMAQDLMLGKSKQNVRTELSKHNNCKFISSDNTTLKYQLEYKTITYKFRINDESRKPKYICAYVQLTMSEAKSTEFIDTKLKDKCWRILANDCWEAYYKNKLIVITKSNDDAGNIIFTYREN